MTTSEWGGIAVVAIVPVLGVIYAVNPWGIVHGKGPATPTDDDNPDTGEEVGR